MSGPDANLEAARRAGFVPLVRLLERRFGQTVAVGAEPEAEAIRFRHDPSLAFPAGDVSKVAVAEALAAATAGEADRTGRAEVTTTFLGLTGSVSPLPSYLADEAAREDRDASLVGGFLDLFHHRLLSLLYQGLRHHDVAAGWEGSAAGAPWADRIASLAGAQTPLERDPATGVAAWRLLRLAPLLVEPCLTAAGLATAMEDLLQEELEGARVEVVPFSGGWMALPEDQITRLGVAGRLGRDMALGLRVWDPAGSFKVLIGPLDAAQYARFTAAGLVAHMERLTRSLMGEAIEHEVLLLLDQAAAPCAALGRARLGRDAWLGAQRQMTHRLSGRAPGKRTEGTTQ